MSRYAWVTLATNDSYSLGALVLAHSLKRVSTAHQLAILITPTVSESMRNKLKDVYNIVQEVNVLDSQDAANLALLARPELGITFTKIHCWRLIQFEKCVFLDADTLVLQNCDELFEREELSAAPDVGWPDCFNSGVFVFRPNLDTFAKITQFALEKGSFDGGDQGLLNSYFADWATSDISKHLPFLYNTCSTATYSYLPAFKQFADRIKILHFIGQLKPWLLNFNSQSKTVYTPQDYGHLHMFLQFWWDLFCDNVHSNLTDDMGGLAAALSKVRLGEERTPEQEAYEQHIRRQCWESGNIDYSGRDSFDNIWKKISETLSSGSKPAVPKPVETKPVEKKPPQEPGKRLTSADIKDGKVELDKKTGVKTTYKLIEGGFQKTIETPQPNGTMKIETQTFYDPKPLTDEEMEMANKPEGTYKKGNVTTVVKKIPGGKQLTITTINADGTQTIQTQTVYEATEEEITEMTETEQNANKKKVTSKKVPGGTAFDSDTKKKLTHEDSTTTEEVSVKSKRTVEESRKVTETHEVSGKATKTTKKSKAIEDSDTPAIENKPKKASKPKKCPLPADFVEKPGEKTTLEKRKVESGTEYIFTTVLADGRTEVTRKTVQEEEGVDMDEEEIEEYNKQLELAEKYKNLKKTKKIHTEHGTKTIMPTENEGEITTVETIQIEGGTEYHYTTICADGTVKKSTKTVYDKVQVEGSEEEYEEVEEYEEEIIEPGEPIVETIETIKTITAEDKRLTSADIEDGKVVYDKKTGIRTTYTKITNGYQITIETPQPNGTMKTETKTFYDPRPVTNKDDDDTPKKTPKGKDSKALVPKKAPGAIAIDPSTTSRTIVHQGSTTTHEEIHVRSQRTVEETRHYSQTSTEVTGTNKTTSKYCFPMRTRSYWLIVFLAVISSCGFFYIAGFN